MCVNRSILPFEYYPLQPGFAGFNWGGGGQNFFNDGNGGGVQFTFGIGAFPFTLFASAFNLGQLNGGGQQAQNQQPNAGARETAEDEYMSRLFLFVAAIFIVWLMIV